MSSPINFHQLPQISLSKLYNYIQSNQKIKSSSSFKSKSNISCQDHIPSYAHNDGIKIQSPFYQRHHDGKGTCTCAYHRMKRYKQQPTLIKGESNNKIKLAIQQYKMRIAAAVKASTQYKNALSKQIFPHKIQDYLKNTINMHRQKQERMKQKQKQKQKQREALDNYNYIFQQILKKRMAPFQNHEKVSRLIKFIRITSNQNPSYLKNTRDYIYLHLMKTAHKIPFDQLLNTVDGNQNINGKIAQIINGTQDIAKQFVKSVQKASKDYQNYLISLAKQKFQRKSIQNKRQSLKIQRNSSKMNSQAEQNETRRSKYTKMQQQIQNIYKGLQNNDVNDAKQKQDNKKFDSLFKVQLKKKISTTSSINDISSNRKKGKRSYLLAFGSQNQDRLKENASMNEQSIIIQKKSRKQALKQQSQKQNKRISKFNQKSQMRKSKFSLQKNNKIAQIKQQDGEQKIAIDKKNPLNQSKRRQKQRIVQRPNPFNSINYSDLLTKDQFQKVKYILNTQDSPTIDQQRMRRLFNLLILKISNNPQFIQEFIAVFKQVLTQQQISILRKRFADNLLRIMIQKLTKQLDNCIMQVQNSSPSEWRQQQQLLQAKRQKQNILLKKTLQFESVHQNQALIDQFNKFTIIEDIPVPLLSFQMCPLQQKQLSQLVLQQLIFIPQKTPRISMDKIRKSRSTCKQQVYRLNGGAIDQQKHRHILRYMKKRYPSTFNSVKSNIKDVLTNNSLIF